MVKIIVQIPAYNEEEKIVGVIKKIPREINGNPVEIVVIDDCSSDNTAQVSKDAGADYVITHDYNKGVGGAFKTGVIKFFELGADILVNIDADGQFNPMDIPQIIQPILNLETAICLASRFGKYKPTNMPKKKYRMNKMISWAVSVLLNNKVEDLTCGFRAYTRDALLRLNLIESFTYTQETIIDAIGKRIKLLRLPIHVEYFTDRKSRVTKNLAKYIFRSVRIVLRTAKDTKPAVFFGLPGLISATAGLMLLLTFLIFYLSTFRTTPFKTFYSVGSFLFGLGIVLMLFAAMADMMRSQRRVTESNMYLLRKIYYDKK